jgi:DNA-binding HxlR family transcriptional regulator
MRRHPTTPLDDALRRVGDRWTLLVVDALLASPKKFGELQAAVPGVASNVLSSRLKGLEADGVVVATAYSRRPPRFRYALSARGAELAGALRLLAQWGAAEPIPHAACGTPVEARWYCPTCDRLVDPGDTSDLHYL